MCRKLTWVSVVVSLYLLYASHALFAQPLTHDLDFPFDERLRGYDNIAVNKPTKASHERPGYTSDLAVDGEWYDTRSRWLASEDPPYWLEIDLENVFELRGAGVWTGHNPGVNTHVVTEFQLQYFDEGEWIDIPGAAVKGNASEYVEFVFPDAIDSDRVRFYTERADWAYGVVRVREILIYGSYLDT